MIQLKKYLLILLSMVLLLVTGCADIETGDLQQAQPASTTTAQFVEVTATPEATEVTTAEPTAETAALPAAATESTVEPEATPEPTEDTNGITEDGLYDQKDDVAMYIYLYGHLPDNYMTKKEARKLGWEGGSLSSVVEGYSIGGDYFGNYEGLLPEKEGREYYECDIDTTNSKKRGAKRIIYSNDGLIYYTDDHYESYELLYGDEDQ